MRTDSDRVQDILQAIARIESRTAVGRTDFERDEMLQTWVVHHLEIIGEAVKGLSEDFRRERPEVQWSAVARMRDRLVHGYWDVDLNAVWQVVERDLAPLRKSVQRASLSRGAAAWALAECASYVLSASLRASNMARFENRMSGPTIVLSQDIVDTCCKTLCTGDRPPSCS